MRFAVILSFLLFLSSMLEASYARSIRVSSFITKADANRGLIKLEQYIESNDRLSEIQNNQGFHITVIKTGKYYMHNLQPFTNKKLVQETLDILRTEYEYVFPRKIKFKESYLDASEVVDTYKTDSYEYEEGYQAPKRVSIDREKLINKIDTVLKDNKRKKYLKEEGKSSTTYPELNLDLPTLEYTYLQSSLNRDKKIKRDNLHDSSSTPITLFRSYMIEILIFGGLIVLLLIIAIFYKSKKNKENRITIQEIYN